MSAEQNKNLEYPVLRVTQLDASELDDALLVNLKQSINQDYFKYIQFSFLQKYHVEIFSAIKFLLWYNTYYKHGQTIGQSILDWSYRDDSISKRLVIAKRIAHACIYCLDEWFIEKFPDLLKRLIHFVFKKLKTNSQDETSFNQEEFQRLRMVDKFLDYFKIITKIFSFLNYIIFLSNGKYLNLWERLLGLRPIYKKQQFMREFERKLFERELLWQSYFSLFKFGDSLFDFKKLFAKLNRKLKTVKLGASTSQPSEQIINISVCPICDNQPVMVHTSVNFNKNEACKHAYCYLCIKKALNETNNQYFCNICQKHVYEIEMFLRNENI